MQRDLVGKKPHFRPAREGNNYYRILIYLALIFVSVWVWLGWRRGEVRSPLDPTPTPTRVSVSYLDEAQAYFEAGKLDDPDVNKMDAIKAYKEALKDDPNNAQAWAELARIQTYSSRMLRNDTDRLARMKEAVESATQAVNLAPDESTYHAIRAFALDWYAYNSLISKTETEEVLGEANREASRAFQLDRENVYALAYYAEILADQSKWLQAEQFAVQAKAKGDHLMDTHRVYGYVLETLGQYNLAIQEYKKAADITPNLTFLYLLIGQNYREGIHNHDLALEYFDKAAKINDQLGIKNPLPYIEIAKTYTQQGQFFTAMVNAQKALDFDNTNAQTYGQLGIIFIRARNYESAVPLLKCAVVGCTPEENEMGKAAVQGLPLSNVTVAYYYVEYGTVLAFLSRPNENYCPTALPVLAQVRKAYPEDPFLVGIVDDSEGLCRRVQGGDQPTAIPTPEGTVTGTPKAGANPAGTPAPTRTPRPTPTRTPKEP